MQLDHLLFDVSEHIATLTLNRPEARNAFSTEMRQSLATALEHIRQKAGSDIKAVIITGAGGAFCAGGNVKAMQDRHQSSPIENRQNMREGHRVLKALRDLEMPVIAAVDGPAAGAGCNLALACDFILASERARFIQAFIRIGLVPDWAGMYLLPRIVGTQKAKELIFSGRSLGAPEAKELGLVFEVYDAAELPQAARAFAGRFRHASTDAIGLAKTILNQTFDIDFHTALELEAQAQSAIRSSDYHLESVKRFNSKQPLPFNWDQMDKETSTH
ncbi:MAG: enoyl-CoA hydratase/isomerase family protein [Candidatus Tectomicrobia bacterium]|nr:enoyl-CoA hydratase/isomerase family protein [Candidatus Tectomicrobia bacterium]